MIVVSVISFLYVLFTKIFNKFLFFEIDDRTHGYIKPFAVLLCAAALLFVVYKALFFIKGLVIKKVGFSNTEVDVLRMQHVYLREGVEV